MLNGVINIYKEAGYTSRDAVSKLSGILRQRKIGHTGTLDPAAEGVLPMCVGSATKLCDLLTDEKKEYRAVMKLGIETDTEDTTGVVIKESSYDDDWYEKNLTEERVKAVLEGFLGEILQTPPMYSAKKVGGKRLYELAREGKIVERKPSRITIYRLDLEGISVAERTISITVECSKGTYIRTLCKEIGEKLSCLASMDKLLRTRTGSFLLEQSFRLSEVETFMKEGRIEELITPVEKLFSAYPSFYLKSHDSLLLDNGAPFLYEKISSFSEKKEVPFSGEIFRMYNEEGKFRALYSYSGENGKLKVYKMF